MTDNQPSNSSEPAAASIISRHTGISCDECGVRPLIGVRYKSKHIYDYDICQTCMEEHAAEKHNYAAIAKPIPSREANALGPELDNRIVSSSYRDAADQIGQNSENLAVVAQLHLWRRPHNDTSATHALQSALASNTHLRNIHIHMCGHNGAYGQAITDMAQGLAANTCIERVTWLISKQDRTVAAALAIRDMMETNVGIQSLLLKRTCHGPSTVGNSKPDQAEDAFVGPIFQGLERNRTITKFRLDGYNVLSENSQDHILGAIAQNPSIQRAYVDVFHHEKNDANHRLELLLANNREKWMDRVTDTRTARKDRVEVLLEAVAYPTVEPVSVAYHLLRRCPDLLPNADR